MTTTQRAVTAVGGIKSSRLLENVGFAAGVLVAVAYGLAETLSRVGVSFGEHADHGIPWGLVIIVGGLVLPKTLGKATSGKLWDALATRVGGK